MISEPIVNYETKSPAYRLQLKEEIMATSLAFQSSNSSVQSPQLDLEKLHTEITDRLIIQTETNKHQVDLNRPIHDQTPESHGRVDGHNFKRPYGEGSSSSNNPEVFRVFFKGLLNEESVHESSSSSKPVAMAAIGVAVCDSKDELVFELKKPLDLIKGDRMCRRSVEGEALIEALKAAIALELKRIVFYCDYYPLYQFVSGRWQPKQQKIMNILDQVNLLRKSFTYCEHSLIARKDVKYVFKLAREAINSQISKVVTVQEKLENCVICLDDKSADQFFSIEVCTHRYCYSCVKQHVEVKLLNGVLPKCPHEGCGNEFRFESCEKFLIPKFSEMMRQRLKENSIPVTEKVYCPYPKCSTLMSKTEALGLINEIGAVTCYKCRGNFCINCRVPWHKNMNCAEYKSRNPTPTVEESNLKNLAARNLWRQCIKCNHMIELAAGCYHMTCICGYEFCYTCGAEWKDKKATCSCRLWDEENIVDGELDNEDDVFNHFVVGVALEDEVFLEDDVVHEDDYYNDFEDDVLEDYDFDDDVLQDDVILEDYDFDDDVLQDDGILEDDYFEDDVAHEDDVLHEDDYFEDDVAPEDDVLHEDDVVYEGDDFEHDVVPGDVVPVDDVVHEGDYFEHDVVAEDVYFEHDDVPVDEYGDFGDAVDPGDYYFEPDVPGDEYGDFGDDVEYGDDEFW